jgi:hypothetical protein
MPPDRYPKLVHTRTTAAITYHFRPDNDLGWALATVNDDTNELTIQSDWGNWSYRWGHGNFGDSNPTLTHFIGGRSPASCNYLADKLWKAGNPRGSSYGGQVFDADATVEKLRNMLARARLEQGRAHLEIARDFYEEDKAPVGFISLLDAGACHRESEKREYWSGISNSKEPLTAGIARQIWDALGSLSECDRSFDLLIERFFKIDGYAWVTEEPWEHVGEVEDGAYGVLLRSILPALVIECTKRARELDTGAPCLAPVTLKPDQVYG